MQKHANNVFNLVTPMAKGGVASDVDNYRLISLTSGVCKVMERVIVGYLSDYLYKHKLISRQEHGRKSQRQLTYSKP